MLKNFKKFGKGVYFADMVSKSANYCAPTVDNQNGLLLLSEVALGNMYEREHAELVQTLPEGKNSTKGLGSTIPNPKESYVDEAGVEIPFGKSKSSGVKNPQLLYNEYVVYNVDQIFLKYLLRVEFKF